LNSRQVDNVRSRLKPNPRNSAVIDPCSNYLVHPIIIESNIHRSNVIQGESRSLSYLSNVNQIDTWIPRRQEPRWSRRCWLHVRSVKDINNSGTTCQRYPFPLVKTCVNRDRVSINMENCDRRNLWL